MRKYVKYVLLLLVTVICVLPVNAKAETYEGYTYSLNGDEESVTITGYTGTDTALVIPGEIDGKKVTDIEARAFDNNDNITSAVIPESVKRIPERLFSDCNSLTSVTLPDSITVIGDNTFDGCDKLTDVNIPKNVTKIGSAAFGGCKKLTSVSIPDSAVMGEYVFSGCESLVSVKLPATLKTVKRGTFTGAKSLESVDIPDTVTSIEEKAFWQCEKLVDVAIPDGVTSIGVDAFSRCSSLKSVKVPAGVTELSTGAFEECSSLKDVELPDGLNKMYTSVFAGCTSLNRIKLPDSLEYIGGDAFDGCEKLVSVDIPDKVTTVKDGAFSGCTSLVSAVIPKSVTELGHNAFTGCTKLSDVKINAQIKELSFETFWGCEGLESIVLPNTLEEIDNRAFRGCSSLVSVVIPPSVEYFGDDVFLDCSPNLVIKCEEDSTALQYAKDNDINYEQVVVDPVIDLSKRGTVTGIKDVIYTESPVVQSSMVVTAKPKIAAGEERPADFVLEENKDYEVSYENNTGVGEATVVIKGIGGYKGTITEHFTISLKDISDENSNIVVSGIEDKTYTGDEIEQENLKVAIVNKTATPTDAVETVSEDAAGDDEIVLEWGRDYTVSYRDNEDVGTATVTITGKGNYSGAIDCTFKILPKQLEEDDTDVTGIYDVEYTGSPVTQNNLTVRVGYRRLENGKDYTISYRNNTNVGTAYVKIEGQGNYTGAIEVKFAIRALDITDAIVTGITDQTYTGRAITQNTVVVKVGNKTLVNGTDYMVTYDSNVNVGTAYVIITGKGAYEGSIIRSFYINEAKDNKPADNKPADNKPADNKPADNKPSVNKPDTNKPNANKPNTAKPVETKVDISKAASKIKVTGVSGMTYTGKTLKLKKLVVKQGRKTLKVNSDYTVVYKNNKNIGTASVIIKGKGKYTGRITRSFKISAKKGKVYTVGKFRYKVTNPASNGKGTVTLVGTTYKSADKKFTSLTVASKVTIGGKKFKVTAVGAKAFRNYKRIKTVVIGDNVTVIGDYAFSRCVSMTSVRLGKNVKTVGKYAFYGCKKLATVKITSTRMTKVGSKAFAGIAKKPVVKTSKTKLTAYKKLLKKSGITTKTVYKKL